MNHYEEIGAAALAMALQEGSSETTAYVALNTVAYAREVRHNRPGHFVRFNGRG